MNGTNNPQNLWFTRTFKIPLDVPKRKQYEGFCEGWVAHHDQYEDKVDINNPDERHRVAFEWDNADKTLRVYLYPFDGGGGSSVTSSNLYSLTYSLSTSVTVQSVSAALSDPPVPPPPPPPSGF